MIGRLSQILYVLFLSLHFEGTNGFQSNVGSHLVISRSRLSVATTPNSMSTDNDSTDESSSSSSPKPTWTEVDFKAYGNGYKTVFSEIPYADCQPSSGSIPTDLKGSYFRTGPAMFSAGSIAPPKTSIIQPRDGAPIPDGQNPKRMVKHPYDADGGILGVTFPGDGTATTRFRYVRTIAFTAERRKGQRLYTGMDSTRVLGSNVGQGLGNDLHTPMFRHHLQPGLNKLRKNISNTRAVYWGKRLLSMWEGGQPYKLDSLALSTEGRSQLGGVLGEKDPFGSSMVIDPLKDRALMYRVRQDSKSSELTVFEFNNKFRLVGEEGNDGEAGKSSVDLPGLAILSDMAVTENYALVVQPAVSTTMQFMFTKEPGKVVSVENTPAMLHLIPRVGTNKEPVSLQIPFDGVIEANLQFCNAYEDGNKIIVDAIRSDGTKKPAASSAPFKWPFVSSKADYEAQAAKKSLWRYEVDLSSGAVTKKKLSDAQCYFGSVRPNQSTQKHDDIFMSIGGLGDETAPPQGIAKFDCNSGSMDSWLPEAYQFCGEPMFAPKADAEDDGYLLTILFDGKAEKSELLVFESSAISAGPVCRIPLGIGIPHGLYGCFTTAEEATWSFEEIERRSKLADKIESQGDRWNEVKSDFSGLGLRFDDMEEYFGDSFLS